MRLCNSAVAFIAAIVIIFGLHARAQRQPGAALRTYIAAIRPQLLSPATRSRRQKVTIAVVVAVCALLVIALMIAAKAQTETTSSISTARGVRHQSVSGSRPVSVLPGTRRDISSMRMPRRTCWSVHVPVGGIVVR